MINPIQFSNIQSLSWQYLSNNQISFIEKNSFVNLNELRYLYLDSNNLTIIYSNQFLNI